MLVVVCLVLLWPVVGCLLLFVGCWRSVVCFFLGDGQRLFVGDGCWSLLGALWRFVAGSGRFWRVFDCFCDILDFCIGGRNFGYFFISALSFLQLHDCGAFGCVSKVFVGSAKPLLEILALFWALFSVVFGRFLPVFRRFGARRRLFGPEIFVGRIFFWRGWKDGVCSVSDEG